MSIVLGLFVLAWGLILPVWLGVTDQSWFWLLVVGVPVAFATKPSVSVNFLWTEIHQRNYGGVATWFVLQTLIYAVVATVPYLLARWIAN